jgi:hypothetical protein
LACGKFRLVANRLAGELLDFPDRERVEIFFRSLSGLGNVNRRLRIGALCTTLLRYLIQRCRHNIDGMGQQLLIWLCLRPRSAWGLRALLRLCRGRDQWKHLYIATVQAIGPLSLSPNERIDFCHLLVVERRSSEAIAVAKLLLEANPDDATVRHLLWTALLQKGMKGEAGDGKSC